MVCWKFSYEELSRVYIPAFLNVFASYAEYLVTIAKVAELYFYTRSAV
jgi:hypothetical protein